MQTETVINYQRALEALRSGVPNRDAVRVLGSNQVEVENLFTEKLTATQVAAQQGKQATGLLVAGGFGTGKSHLLEYLEHVAVSNNFVCSRIVISKETPLFDPAKVFQAAIDGAVVPGMSGQVIQEIALRLKPNTQEYAELYRCANSANSGLSPLFPATLLLHERLNNDPELVDQITGFWSGDRLSINRIRQGLKQVNCAEAYTLKPVKLRELAIQRFVFASHLILAAGYSGWVLLIDEVELIGRYSLQQRGKSYAELARWLGQIQGASLPGIVSVAAITDDFGLAVLQEKSDRDAIGPRFRAKGTDEYTAMAAWAETGMRLIERSIVLLQPPDDATLLKTYERLKTMHAAAYSWDPPAIPPPRTSVTRRMRSYVRRWVNEWDLRRLYPGVNIVTDDEQEMKPTYDADEDLETASEPTEKD
ncbi:MAG: BREX system ATP-binding domain-containing protein [Candidatus Sulfotelmatobacter sp.]